MREVFLGWGMLTLSVVFNAFGVFVIKLKLNEMGPIGVADWKATIGYFFLLLKSPLIVLGVIVFFLSPFLFTIALSRMEMTIAYPVQIGMNFFLLILLSVLFLGEQLTLYKFLGIFLICAGIYLLNKGVA